MNVSTNSTSLSNAKQFASFIDALEDIRKPKDTKLQTFGFDEYYTYHPRNHSIVATNGGESLNNTMKGKYVPLRWTCRESGTIATQLVIGSRKKEIVRFHKLVAAVIETKDGDTWSTLSLLDEDSMEHDFPLGRLAWIDDSLEGTMQRYRSMYNGLMNDTKQRFDARPSFALSTAFRSALGAGQITSDCLDQTLPIPPMNKPTVTKEELVESGYDD